MEKIILVNTVETSSQASTEINEYGQVVKIAITDSQQVLFWQADFSGHVEKPTPNLTPQPPSLKGKGENSKPLKKQERGLERGSPDPVKSKFCQVVLAKDKTTAITTSHLQNTIKALERLLKDQKTVKWRICKRPLWQVVQTLVRSL
ncbi:hypothetical protein NIES4075_08580 [Tolypothrix sp. NIES-4075]|uniref:hypothetical protein n=1 Tax=Tolypothrix sp. NIES-4075 TaxID=2005459 RepID=UPI000B5CE783|nr:hypothetical protein [Tolypothrix sp. NIES-4075]GAX39896.1 hypothetical protein NIES4075_08580 [Tolypothrix sp. NIES-4075]